MKRNAGFTLIELIIVIVILGILAVTAAPKFINLQNDARKSTVTAMAGSVKSAAAMTYSKAVLAGKDGAQSGKTVTVDGNSVALVWGYPDASSTGLAYVIDAPSTDWTPTPGTSATGSYILTPVGMTSGASATCKVTYTPSATSGSAPTVVATTDGC